MTAPTSSTEAQLYRNILIPAVSILFITGVTVLVLAAIGKMGPLEGVGAITSMALGTLDITAIAIGSLIMVLKLRSNRKLPFLISEENKALNTDSLYWYSASLLHRENFFGSIFNPQRNICGEGLQTYTPKMGDKLIIVMYIDGVLSLSSHGEEGSGERKTIDKVAESMQDRLLLLLVSNEEKLSFQPASRLIAQDLAWAPIFQNKRYIDTREKDWHDKLNAFLAS